MDVQVSLMDKKTFRLLQGVLLGAMLPLGWAVLSQVLALGMVECTTHVGLYTYLTVAGVVGFGAFGSYMGRREDELARLSTIDHLTGLANIRHFRQILDREFANAQRHETPLTLTIIDLDHFKRINDVHGHPAGDAALQAVARTVTAQVRLGDVVARVGGEEFAVIMPHTPAQKGFLVAERIRKAIAGTGVALADGGMLTLAASLGIAGTDRLKVDSPTDLFAKVDQALYKAKQAGRNQTILADDSQLWLPYEPPAPPPSTDKKS